MNTTRRNFFKTLLTAAAGFSILPPATTYGRIWRAEKNVQIYRFIPGESVNQYGDITSVIEFIEHDTACLARQILACKPTPLSEDSRRFFNTFFFGEPITS